MDNVTDSGKKPAAEEEDEALSLRDFPLSSGEAEKKEASSKFQDKRRSSSEPSDFFEFFNDFSSEMSNAEDIIFCGKLMPYKNPPQILKSLSADDATRLSRTYCHSLPDLTRPRPRIRTRTRRSLIVKPDIHRSSSKSSANSEGSKLSKSRWFVMMFGPLKLQPEMDLRDMKNRQVRRNPRRLFPAGQAPAVRSDRRSFWGLDLLKVLSCKDHASVAVTASIGLVPHF